MKTATWNGVVIAKSDQTIEVEGNHYFPADSVSSEYLKSSATQTTCAWKGVANYYNLDVQGAQNKDAAWFYANPKDAAKNITNYVAFWKGVVVK